MLAWEVRAPDHQILALRALVIAAHVEGAVHGYFVVYCSRLVSEASSLGYRSFLALPGAAPTALYVSSRARSSYLPGGTPICLGSLCMVRV
jgi:hypothetical protein